MSSHYRTAPAKRSVVKPQAVLSTASLTAAVSPAAFTPTAFTPAAFTPAAPSGGEETRSDSADVVAQAPVEMPSATQLTLRVPADAKVILDDKDTHLTGSERTFRTARLAEGEVRSNYCVRVVVEREGGEAAVQERHVNLRGGESHELRFDFDDALLASQ